MNKLSINRLGIAFGLIWAFYVFFCGITAIFGWGTSLVSVLSSLYIGYHASVGGAIIGGIWGFADGYIAGVFIAWIYNKLAK